MKKFSRIINESSVPYMDDDFKALLKKKLIIALAEEINAWYGYFIVLDYLRGPERDRVEAFFKEAMEDEIEHHAGWLKERLNQLGCAPSEIAALTTVNTIANHKYVLPIFYADEYVTVEYAIRGNIIAETGAIETYKDLERFTRDQDPVTNAEVKKILADEEEHLSKLNDFLADITNSRNDDNVCDKAVTAPVDDIMPKDEFIERFPAENDEEY